jgi:predicted metalloprotease with PDZ domain
MMSWPGSQRPTVEITLPLTADQPAQQPAYSSSMGWSERIRRIEAEVNRLTAEVDALTQTVEAQQQQQTPARQPRRPWYRRITVLEQWGDDTQ